MNSYLKILLVFFGIALFPIALVLFLADNILCALINKSFIQTSII